ncbi:MAG: chemotaxis protein CheW [Spirochaetia bacterium]|nr:chemotaxis protein CheW [Spirochaetia bacterium]
MATNFDHYTEMFLDEAGEQIEALNQNLLILEKDGFDQEVINEIFRVAHTMKSSSAFVGLDNLSNLSHHMEDLLQFVKDGKIGISTDLVTLFFDCLDRIKSAVEEFGDGNTPEDRFEDLISSLDQYLKKTISKPAQKKAAAPAKPEAKTADVTKSPAPEKTEEITDSGIIHASEEKEEIIVESQELVSIASESFLTLDPPDESLLFRESSGKQVFDGIVSLEPDSPMKNLRLLLLVQHLKSIGNLFRSDPSEEDLDGETPYNLIKFLFIGDISKKELEQVCHIDMVSDVRIEPRDVKGGRKRERKDETGTIEDVKTKTKNIKVSSEKIDYLLNSVGELVITNSGLMKIYEDLLFYHGDSPHLAELKSKIDQAARIAKDLQSGIMKTRMIPVGLVFQRYTRPVRDLSLELGKDVDLVFQGEDTELDKNIIDSLNDPMMHLLRNSLDHGIETVPERRGSSKPERATLLLNAYQSGNNIYVEIRDDGRGLNKDRILKKAKERGLVSEDATLTDDEIYQMIFHPGFSTAEKVSDLSGRGVGMNVVKNMVSSFKGSVQVKNIPGQGCSFIMAFPMTLAIVSAIIVKIQNEEYAFPLSDVVETIRVTKEDVTTLQGRDIINLRGDILPVYNLSTVLGLPPRAYLDEFPIIVANSGIRKVGFIVDEMIGKQEIVIKTLEKNFRAVSGLVGACLMGDGSIVMVLDIMGLLELSQSDSQSSFSAFDFSSIEFVEKYNSVVKSLQRKVQEKAEVRGGAPRKAIDRRGLVKKKEEKKVPVAATRSERAEAILRSREEKEKILEAEMDNKLMEEFDVDLAGLDDDDFIIPSPSNFSPSPRKKAAKVEEMHPDDVSAILDEAGISETEDSSVGSVMEAETTAPTDEFHDSDTALDQDERVEEALKSFRVEKEQRVHRALDILVDEDHSSTPALSDEDYNRLYAVVNTGMMNAGFVLSQLLGLKVEVSVPDFKAVDFNELQGFIPDEEIIGITLETEGDFQGLVLFILDEATGYHAAGDLMGLPMDKWSKDAIAREDILSVLSELTNIVGSSVLNALANKTGLTIYPSVPGFIQGEPAAIIRKIDEIRSVNKDLQIIYVSTDFYREDMQLLGRMFLLPTGNSLAKLLDRL